MFWVPSWRRHADEAAALSAKKPARALELLDRALEEAPENGADSPRFRVLAQRARLRDRLGQVDEAEADRRELAAAAERELAEVEAQLASGVTNSKRLAGLRRKAELVTRLDRPPEEVEAARAGYLEALEWEIAHERGAAAREALLRSRAEVLEQAGRMVEGARSRLMGADVMMAAAGDRSARAALTRAPAFAGAPGHRHLELNAGFRAGYVWELRSMAEAIRAHLMEEGRAAGVGRCRKCGAVVGVSARGRCGAGHRVDDLRFVVPQDAEAARAELAAGPPDVPGRERGRRRQAG